MEFETWLRDNDYDAQALTERQRQHLHLAFQGQAGEGDRETSFDATMAAIEAENARVEHIRDASARAASSNVGNAEKIRQIRLLGETAIADRKTGTRDFDLALLRLDRSAGPMVLTPRGQPLTNEVLEAAVCQAGGLESLSSHYDEQTLDLAHKQFKGGLGLAGLITICARAQGYRGHDFKSSWYEATQAAFRGGTGGWGEENGKGWGGGAGPMAAVTGPSTYSLPIILSNVANKFLRVGFESVDDTWRNISARRSFNDFKTATTAALTGSLLFSKLPPSGELKHGQISEISYTNKADTYGVMLGIDRQSLVNDDLGALTSAGRRLGRGGALALNNVFWSVFLNNAAFFTAGRNNVITGATSALSLEGLELADEKFRLQTDPDGMPLGTTAAILLVPPSQRVTALSLMTSTTVVSTTTADRPLPDQNVFVGAYQVYSSPYMQSAALTGNSATAWYLLASPDDMPVIEVGFLNGAETPTVETMAAEFSMLGIALRGWHDFGCSMQEYRGGVRATGA